ncbi:hypothetical protein PoB_004712700 [Plakobranchus ocellatus]|uniref:Galectin n=1 Tax=Plakobranchus ocellatus TaxID=259542 RepID=A0AAV4BMJ3_9GAST|nr:hypothetical protein PoB_004712700 [Plakobranchus ocellatus]
MSTLVSESTRYVRCNDLTFKCNSDLIPLTSSSTNYLVCARKCEQQPDCTVFMFTRYSPGVQDAACSWCPAKDIVSIIYTPADPLLETWVRTLGFLVFPNNSFIKEPIPTTLSVGQVVFFQGRVPELLPDRCIFSLNVDSSASIAARIEARFNYAHDYKRVAIFTLRNSVWTDHYFPREFFPFSAGQKVDIAVLGTSEGFDMYLNGELIKTVTSTTVWIGQINLVIVTNLEEVLVTF